MMRGELKKIREELQAIRRLLESRVENGDASSIPAIPMLPPVDQCVRCGTHLGGVSGFVCSDPGCPSGLGPVTS